MTGQADSIYSASNRDLTGLRSPRVRKNSESEGKVEEFALAPIAELGKFTLPGAINTAAGHSHRAVQPVHVRHSPRISANKSRQELEELRLMSLKVEAEELGVSNVELDSQSADADGGANDPALVVFDREPGEISDEGELSDEGESLYVEADCADMGDLAEYLNSPGLKPLDHIL